VDLLSSHLWCYNAEQFLGAVQKKQKPYEAGNESVPPLQKYTGHVHVKIIHTWFFMEKPEGKRQFGKPTCRWRDNIEKYLQETDCNSMD
jgi:hypothetical protein